MLFGERNNPSCRPQNKTIQRIAYCSCWQSWSRQDSLLLSLFGDFMDQQASSEVTHTVILDWPSLYCMGLSRAREPIQSKGHLNSSGSLGILYFSSRRLLFNTQRFLGFLRSSCWLRC